MKRRMFFASLVVALCISIVTSGCFAGSPAKLRDLKPEEIEKIKAAVPEKPTVEPAKPRKMLVFWLCEGFYHRSIPVANEALRIMGKKTGAYEVVTSNDMGVFTKENLKQYDAICFNNTTGLKFNPEKTPSMCEAVMDFVKSGKGIVGIHAGADNFPQWEEARQMIGNRFTGHPWGGGGTWGIKIDEPDHPLTAAFEGENFKIKDEIYRTDPPLYDRSKLRVVMSLDMSDEKTAGVGGLKPNDKDTGIAWIRPYGKGRVFYCSLGHNDEIFWNPAVLQHYLDGIQYAFGDYKMDDKPKP